MNLNLANSLSLTRMGIIPFFIFSWYTKRPSLTLYLFIAAGITDYLDGYIARSYNQRTDFGSYLDPIADKLLTTASFIIFSIDIGYLHRIPPYLTSLVISRDVIIASGALIMRRKAGAKKFPVLAIGKFHTGAQAATIGLIILFNLLGARHILLSISFIVTLSSTLLSGFSYIYSAVEIMEKEGKGSRVPEESRLHPEGTRAIKTATPDSGSRAEMLH